MRKKHQIEVGTTILAVSYNRADEEYQVKVYENGLLNEKRTYFTDDKHDALDTLVAMAQEEERDQNKPRKYQDYVNLAKLWDSNGTSTKYYARCREKIDERYDFVVIANALAGEFNNYVKGISNGGCLMNEFEIKEEGADPCFGICCGNVLRMNPSGKYYTPWANSNISAREALQDEIYREALEDALEEYGMFSQSGEGDPLDVFFCKCFG